MGIIAERNAVLNDAIDKLKVLEVFKDIYHPEIEMYENTDLVGKGLDANLDRERQFFGAIVEFRGGGVTKTAVDEELGISFAEMWFDAVLRDGSTLKMTEVAVRKWKDGKIIHEQFFYKGS
jgi:hypothetical protein